LGRRSRPEIQAVLREDSSEQVLSMSGVGKRSITMPGARKPSGAGPNRQSRNCERVEDPLPCLRTVLRTHPPQSPTGSTVVTRGDCEPILAFGTLLAPRGDRGGTDYSAVGLGTRLKTHLRRIRARAPRGRLLFFDAGARL